MKVYINFMSMYMIFLISYLSFKLKKGSWQISIYSYDGEENFQQMGMCTITCSTCTFVNMGSYRFVLNHIPFNLIVKSKIWIATILDSL